MRLGAPDASGRRAPEIDPAGGFDVPADLVIKALGFDAEDLPTLFGARELGVTRWGTVLVDNKTLMTSLDGVFAAGDIVRGASLVVWAIRDGRDVAAVAGSIVSLLRDPGTAAAMGAAGRAWVERDWTWDASAARLKRMLASR